MRFHLVRPFRRCCAGRREDAGSLPSRNRCFVAFLLFLMALTGTWHVTLWLSTAADFSEEYYIEAEVNVTEANDAAPKIPQPSPTARKETELNEPQSSTVATVLLPSMIFSQESADRVKIDEPTEEAGLETTAISAATATSKTSTVSTSAFRNGTSSIVSTVGVTGLANQVNCTSGLFVIVVHSAVENRDRRNAIRQTWGQKQPVIFMLGRSANSSQDTANIDDEESRVYGDLVKGQFIDSYRNLTYKHLMALNWARINCQNVDYIVKIDDDVFVNVPRLKRYLNELRENKDASSAESKCNDDSIYCDVVEDAFVKRSYRSKWRLGYREYRPVKYPSYCNGWAVIYSCGAVPLLLNQTEKVPFLWIDDVYVTGLLSSSAQLKPVQMKSKLLGDAKDLKNYLKNSNLSEMDDFVEDVVMGPPQLSIEEMNKLWGIVSSHNKVKKSNKKAVILSYY